MEDFSKSSRVEDEKALKWAALVRLPTDLRIKRGLHTETEGQAREVDIRKLGLLERKSLIERLVKNEGTDNEMFLLKLKERIDRLTLLLGPPTSGKTTLLLALAGKLGKDLKLTGRVTYNGHGMEEFVPQRTSAYVSQDDLHIGEMTVRETLAFSARCQGVGPHHEMLAELLRREKAANIKPDPDIDMYMKILGLEVCADAMVGDTLVRGVSGGEKKRVTTGEMLVGPARALFMDHISTASFGNLFDDIILLSEGQIVYQGPCENVLEFFASMGFKCPERKGVADFLQEVISKKDQEQYWAGTDKPYSFVTVNEFAEAFQSFHIGQKLEDELATPFDKSKSIPAALTTKKYVQSKELFRASCSLSFNNDDDISSDRDASRYSDEWWNLYGCFVLCCHCSYVQWNVRTQYGHQKTSSLLQATYSIPIRILNIPISFVEAAIWVFNQMACGLFRLIAAVGRTVAGTIGAFSLLVVMVLGGFSRPFEIYFTTNVDESSTIEDQTSIRIKSSSAEVGRNCVANQNGKQGMALPFQPHSLSFDEVRYSIDMPQEMKAQGMNDDRLELLKGVSGAFRPRVLTALMGVTGAGKTTLIDVLAGRKTGGRIEGSIMISGYPKKQETFARISGYCEQNDVHSPHVTVYESLLYSAWLRLPHGVDYATRKMFIEEVMDLVEMTSLSEALVGLPGVNGLSTEQRKRLTIAVELVANLVLLKLGGEQVYGGPLGPHSSNLIKYFEAIHGVPKIRDGYNPATWMLDITSAAQESSIGVSFADCTETLIALLLGIIFWNLGSKCGRLQDLFNAMGSMYAAIIFIGAQNGISIQEVVNIERTVSYRETAAAMYSVFPYAFAQIIIEIPYVLIQTVIYGVIVYVMIGFDWTVSKFFWYLFFMYFSFLYFTFCGMMTMAMTPKHHRIPIWWKWYYWVCPVAWTLRIGSFAIWRHKECA
ncbi:hypothetical protein FNV43_RR12369 [Rhamnella rubrinervis]|uniref:ABC transporter domain-containing protein n=1 Tax=Rhamnella rubrinervis TaxID=2594499 RepID=A0A8K0H7R5_9ROSA|nr:hypothetical protein FNV43_RR12369 [Rhamnella rubrinervis]